MDNIIELKRINKIYGNEVKRQVLFDIDLQVKEGSFVSIIGQSGSGKSTLLNIIGTLDKSTNGEVYINNIKTDNMNKNELALLRNKTIGFIFQFHYLLPEFSAIENILIPYRILNKKVNKESKKRALDLLELVGLKGYENYKINMMSGGMQQRVSIARALMNNPKIVLADEPTGNLDSESTELIYNLLRQINLLYKTTFIIITHDRKMAERADRIIEINDGKIELDLVK